MASAQFVPPAKRSFAKVGSQAGAWVPVIQNTRGHSRYGRVIVTVLLPDSLPVVSLTNSLNEATSPAAAGKASGTQSRDDFVSATQPIIDDDE